MTQKIKCLSKEICHKGFLNVTKYNFEIPSLDTAKEAIKMQNRELISGADSILVLLYVPAADSFLLCQEFRLGVYLNPDKDNPFILECVSGIIDKNSNPEETAKKEIHEETGLTINNLIKIAAAYKSPGIMTEKCHLYYAEVVEIPQTGIYGLEGEEIKTTMMKRNKVYELMDEMKIVDSATLIALTWFRARPCDHQNSLAKNVE
ncbi:NUDIX domain-containing protein [Legionella clemsonensis]|uniref:ADP-ribose pyrophosphatase n=1 Tax=Legionella clemsonensis TaxID=1867846 RepID=A0A222P6F2_9GAMM|nr:NUDIX hydrolase [Legionella clemsonensis]ASQ47431.1 ADP-ribose pyrophosphatase [Legionella clemsonensis]